ncbi:hypothetical protein ACQQ6W_23245 [Lysinibacillus fusiformis]
MNKIVHLLLFFFVFLGVFVPSANAAQVYKNTTSIVGAPKVQNGELYFAVSPTALSVKHAKYVKPDFSSPVDIAFVKSKTRVTGFAYKCPGYYTTRLYSDREGMNMIGYVQTYVSKGDASGGGCASITEPTNTPTPPVPKPIHPVPSVDVKVNKVSTEPKKSANYSAPVSEANQKCREPGETSNWQLVGGSLCCPADWKVWYDHDRNAWVCGDAPSDITSTYCSPGDKYNSATGKCESTKFEYTGNPGEYPLALESYEKLAINEDVYSVGSGGASDGGNGEDGGGEESGEGCDLCKIFECPGWEDYLGTLYDIADYAIGDVDPPPVPDLPRPSPPNIFDVLNDVEQRNPTKPTGQDGMGDTPFDATDVKNSAPEIPVREDPTGGFNIVDPLTTLPEDGSTAPRPQEELEDLPYPGGSGNKQEGIPKPSNSGEHSTEVPIPKDPGGSAKPSDTGGSAKYPIP